MAEMFSSVKYQGFFVFSIRVVFLCGLLMDEKGFFPSKDDFFRFFHFSEARSTGKGFLLFCET